MGQRMWVVGIKGVVGVKGWSDVRWYGQGIGVVGVGGGRGQGIGVVG